MITSIHRFMPSIQSCCFKVFIIKLFTILLLGNLGQYEGGKPDATFSFKDDDFIKVVTGKMNPQIAYLRYNSLVSISLPFIISIFLGGSVRRKWGLKC